MTKSIIRARGGTAEREVQLSDIIIQDIQIIPLFLRPRRKKQWIAAVVSYYEKLKLLLRVAQEESSELPNEFFVPDLWHPSQELPKEEREILLDMWGLGHDLCRGLGYTHSSSLPNENEVGGTTYILVR